ncbi:group II intron reverse transcriptase/maturase [Peribacillus butanolivorans]|uniref:RNA-directed DNA polymerase n=1 Tax=Peribacillus butanolivorans TaxID=421767 RepID=A0ABN5ND99_9BACI|nr:group II intron reverse transcriptase/maturase [Peribacillus butanolivorans]AXN41490.1 group II intron reverse transcriptase/maturase [Peribacillus butanolivorans]
MLMEQILERENLIQALKRVERNKGSHGVDGMPVQNLRPHLATEWYNMKTALLQGTYQPQPVRRIEIPKPNGGVRLLGIPTVLDRFIQQAIAQILTKVYDSTFSENSYGFRPNKQGHQAVRKAKSYITEGYTWVVDMDLEKFFDKVNHDKLMGMLERKIEDKRVLKLIRKFLQAGIMIGGLFHKSEEGTPQGGPLSPLLSNIMLDDLDKELEKRNLRFVRYADDSTIFVKTRKAAKRAMGNISSFIENKLKLKVNYEKSKYDRPWNRTFLGFSFTKSKKNPKVLLAKQTVKRVKKRIREMTSRKLPIPMKLRINKLKQYLRGWMGYFALIDTPNVLMNLDSWIRRRLRMCLWKHRKLPRTRVKKLKGLGVPFGKAYEWGNSRKGYWRIAHSPILDKTLNNVYWLHHGLVNLYERYTKLRQT